MVLGLGSRSKKDRASAVSQLVELELHLHEIKPWLGLAKPSKIPTPVALRWGRGGRLMGSSRNVTPASAGAPDAGRLSLGESLRIAVAPNREILKRAKKSYPDLDEPLIFSLQDVKDPKEKPLAQATLDLSSLASITESKLVAVPFIVSKKVAKGSTSYLHLTVQKYQDDRPSSPAASASLGTSGRTSDASSLPPLDEDTQQSLVAALLSDSEDNHNNKEEGIDSFTDDDDEDMKEFHLPVVPQNISSSQENRDVRPPLQNPTSDAGSAPAATAFQRVGVSLVQGMAEKQSDSIKENSSGQAVAFAKPSPVKAAAIAAAAAYTKKHSFLPRRTDSFMNDSDNSSSDLDIAGEDEFSSGFSKTAQLPSLPKGSSNTAADVEANALSERGINMILDDSLEKGTKEEAQKNVNVQTEVKDAAKVPLVDDMKSKLNGHLLLPTNSTARIMQEAKVPIEERMGLTEKDGLVETIPTTSVVPNSRNPPEQKPKAAVKTPVRDRGQQKSVISKSPDTIKGRKNQSPAKDSRTYKTTMQDGKGKAFKSPDHENERFDKKEIEETKQKPLYVEGKGSSGQSNVQHMEAELEKLRGELRDVAAVEAALYSTTSEHGSSSTKLHAPARRLARVYLYSCKHCSPQRRASCARTTMSGLVLTTRACGNDVARLTFWWSNTAVLREIISISFKTFPEVSKVGISAHQHFSSDGKSVANSPSKKMLHQEHHPPSAGHPCEDWRELSTFIAALERLESWIYTKVVESIWWQVMTPRMQEPEKQAILDMGDDNVDMRSDYGKHEKKRVVNQELEDARQRNVSVEIWKKAFLDAYERLCPVRVLGVQCGCLPMLNRLVLEACVRRLDVAMFNAILRDDEIPTDPVSDPISHVLVLPIPNSSLSFGRGAQLKNAVANLSSFISNLTKKAGDVTSDGISDDDEQNIIAFPLLKAMGGLLMLPKDMLMDKSLRKEVCPTLELSFIARILSKFQPDEFSPEPIAPELLDTINAEVAAEQEDMDDCGSTARIAVSASVVYNPQSSIVRHWIGDLANTDSPLRRTNSSILRKGHTSDDELDELESPITWLFNNTTGSNWHNRSNTFPSGAMTSPNDVGGIRRFKLLREVWSSS